MQIKPIIAFHNDPQLRKELVDRAEFHRAADSYRQSFGYWEVGSGKGCSIGCLSHNPDGAHADLAEKYNIPLSILYLQEYFFENLPVAMARDWTPMVVNSIQCGADLSLVTSRFLLRLLEDLPVDKVKSPQVWAAVDDVAALYRRRLSGDEPSEQEWDTAAGEAVEARAAWAARAARTAWEAGAAWAAWGAGEAREAREARAAWAARAARTAWEARAAWGARAAGEAFARAAGEAFAKRAANWLVEELRNAPIPSDLVFVDIVKRGDPVNIIDDRLETFASV
jgi:hypothetical protein